MTPPVYIVAARRTPQGRFLGALRKRSAVDLAVAAGEAVLEQVAAEHVDEVILGHVIGAGQGLNPARQVGLRLNLPQDRPAFTVNQACASGMLAVVLAAQAIRLGESHVVLCGGTESMTNAPHLLPRARAGIKLGNATLTDALLGDGLSDPIHDEHMALTAERLATELSISRERQDRFAARSHRLALRAQEAGTFAGELAPLPELEHDEHPRADATLDALGLLKPAFDPDGCVTAGNASGINDGAAMLVLASAAACQQHGWQPLAQLGHEARVGCDPLRMGLGPAHAIRALGAKADQPLTDFDTIEINEAFAAQTLACLDQLGLPDSDDAPVNRAGGAIALGHPVGASGARLVVHLAHRVAQGHSQRAIGSLCAGGGMGIALSLNARASV